MNAYTHHRSNWLIGIALLLVLIVTRSGHFGSRFTLPDASWAMFWLSGALALRWWWQAILISASAAVDYFVIGQGISSYCVTPAYPFLIPAYLSLWLVGCCVSKFLTLEANSVLWIAISILIGVTLAYFISNASFYFFSGYLPALTAWQYIVAVIKYWPSYLVTTAVYAGVGLLLNSVVRELRNLASPRYAGS